MPSYAWVCFACQRTNAAGAERCENCGFNAGASASEIVAAQRRIANAQALAAQDGQAQEPPSNSSTLNGANEPSALIGLLMVGFGVLCLFGAYSSFAAGHWPPFMPPQLDLFAVPLSWLSERLGAYVGGALAVLVGVVCIIGGLASAKRRNAA